MGLLDLFRSKRSVVCTIREREGHGLLAFANTQGIAVHVKESYVAEELATSRLQTLNQLLSSNALVNNNCQVNGDAWIGWRLNIGRSF